MRGGSAVGQPTSLIFASYHQSFDVYSGRVCTVCMRWPGCTYLRYKRRLFAPDKLEAIKQWAIDEARFEPSNPRANTLQLPPAKKARAGTLDVLDAILGAPAPTSSASSASLVDAELSAYLQADVIGQAESPTEWRAANAAKYPLLAAEAKRYLSALPTSVTSEHVFSV